MEVPAFLFDLLNQQLRDIHEALLDKVAKRYALSAPALKEEFLEPLVLVPDKQEKVVIYKKQRGRTLPTDEHRCMARIWNRGKGGQCTRFRKGEGAVFCCQHLEKRKHGVITEDPPQAVFHHTTKVLYK